MPRIIDHEIRRVELADAACKAIARHGIDSVKLTDVGDIAGCTTGAITHYFADKAALLAAALDHASRNISRRMDERLEADETDFIGYLAENLPLNRQSRIESVVWYNFWVRAMSETGLAKRQRAIHRLWRKQLERAIVGLQQAGEIEIGTRMDEEVEALSAVINGIALRATLDPRDWPARRQIDQLQFYLDRLRPASVKPNRNDQPTATTNQMSG